ncbi:SpiroCoCo family coiled-coil protein [Treponema pedis]|uniref:SpiroCoCo family coiled-coil protein n=1 Tax=Treponema pedis TaxID=409322 RepID=UPI0004033F72|nr:hypothetical protein [Treponema pedis]
MIYIVLNIVTLIICIAIIIGFRQSDKNNRSIEKAKRYGEKIKEDLDIFINEKRSALTDLTTELGVQQTRAIATVKKLDEVYDQFMKNTGTIETRSAAIQEIDRYITKSEQTVQKLMDMTALAEKNLTEIGKEADFIDSLAKSINKAKAELSDVTGKIPEMQNRFAEEADAKLEVYKTKILEEMQLVIDDVENRLAAAQKNTNDVLEVAAIKLQDIYKQAYTAAADKAGSLQEAAFAKLKEETAERVQNYRREFEETSAQLETEINSGLEEAKQAAAEFKSDWETQIKDFISQIQYDITKTEEDINGRIDSIMEKLNETENSSAQRSDSLSADLNQTEAVMRSQFNSLASNFQDNINSLAKFTDKKLSDFKTQTESRFTKFEETIAGVDSLKEEIEKAQENIKAELLAEISAYASSIKQTQQNFLSEFTGNSDRINERMKTIDASIEELKTKAYANVSEKLKMFEDDFFADLAKRSDAISLSFDQWKEDVSANMALLASENESSRKDIETQYKQELRTRIAQAAEEYKQQFLRLDEKVGEISNNLNTRLSAADDRIQSYADKLNEDVNKISEKAVKHLEGEISVFKAQLQDAIRLQNGELENGAKILQERLASIREESEASLETVKKDFEAWKNRTDQQFTEARSLFDDKITSFESLTENAIKNLDAKYNSQYRDFITKSGDSFENIQAKIDAVDGKIASINDELTEHAAQITAKFNGEVDEAKTSIDKKLRDASTEAERSVQKINEMILAVRTELDETQEKIREKIQSDADRLNSVIEEIDKKQNAFVTQTRIFERADELKAGLEKDIEDLKGEVTRFEVYRNAIDNLSLQYEKVTHLEEEANIKIARFMSERKNIELLESEFVKLNTLSDSMDKKIIELTGVNDDLQQYQVQIRKLEEGIGDVNTRYERLEKKGAVLDQTMQSIDSAFEDLKELEAEIKNFKADVNNLPPEIEKIKTSVDTLLENHGRAEEVCERIETLDSSLEELNEKMESLKQARSWLAATETRLKDISKNSEEQLKLMADLFKSEKGDRLEDSIVPRSKQENVLQLSRQGWKEAEIAKALNLSVGEVDLILEYSDKI